MVFYYLTFDIGTTALKTALISNEGLVAAANIIEYVFNSPRPGWAEVSPGVYWQSVIESTHAVLKQSGISPSAIAAIGFSSQGQTYIPIDATGRSLSDAVVWVDDRSREIVKSWRTEWLSDEEYCRISGYPRMLAELTVFKIAWLAKNRPDAHKAWKFLCLPDYLTYKMTGETVTDHTMAQFTGLYNIHTQSWESKLLEAVDISVEQLPKVIAPGCIAGHLRSDVAIELGIPAGVPVCGGANDQIAGAVGAGNVSPGIVSETTGTALAVVITTKKMIDEPRAIVGRHASDFHFVMPYANTSAIVLTWFRDICGVGSDYNSFLSGVEDIAPGCDGLTVLPHFAGTASPTFNPNAKGVIEGLTLSHTRQHISRAIMESCACLLKECLEIIEKKNIDIRCVRSLGGAAHNDLWLQIKADMLGVPVERPVCSDAASLGAAMLAATGTGQFASVQEASHAWYKHARSFEPDSKKHALYDNVYIRYLSLYDRLYNS